MAIRVLIADDASMTRMILKSAFSSDEFEIVGEAKNGNEAVELYEQTKPDIVTMDITMREKNGIEALEEIKKKYPEAKIIMVSAMGNDDYVKKAIELGADEFVVKPFSKEKLVEVVKKVYNG